MKKDTRKKHSIRAKIEALIKLYKRNIADNDSRIKEHFNSDKLMKCNLNSESDCLRMVISELKEIIKLKSDN